MLEICSCYQMFPGSNPGLPDAKCSSPLNHISRLKIKKLRQLKINFIFCFSLIFIKLKLYFHQSLLGVYKLKHCFKSINVQLPPHLISFDLMVLISIKILFAYIMTYFLYHASSISHHHNACSTSTGSCLSCLYTNVQNGVFNRGLFSK